MVLKRPCAICGRWFLQSKRGRNRQRVCSRKECQRERHRGAYERWRLARLVAPKVRGWMAYYCRFWGSEFQSVAEYIDHLIVRWARFWAFHDVSAPALVFRLKTFFNKVTLDFDWFISIKIAESSGCIASLQDIVLKHAGSGNRRFQTHKKGVRNT
jgi:hypothetical protein